MFEKVLVLSASAGAGHLRAAEAVRKAFERLGAAREVRHIDTLEYTNKVFRRIYSKMYIDLIGKSPDLLGWLYDYMDKPWENERRRWAFNKLNTRPFVKMLEEYQPDIAVCTHFLPAETRIVVRSFSSPYLARIPVLSFASLNTGSIGMPVTVILSAGMPNSSRWARVSSIATKYRS